MNQRASCQRGAVLLEWIVAAGILALVLGGLYGVFQSQQQTYALQEDLSQLQQDLRLALEQLVRDIRMAGYGVPRGVSPIASIQNGTIADPNAPDTLVLNRAPGPWTVPTSDTLQPGNWIDVKETQGFTSGQTVQLLRLVDFSLEGTYEVTGVDPTGNRIALSAAPTTLDGVILTQAYQTITYQVVFDPVTGIGSLQRTDWVGPQTLAQGIQDLQLVYILEDGTQSEAPTDLAAIRQVQITLTGVTRRDVSQVSGVPRSRTIQTVVAIRNLYGVSG